MRLFALLCYGAAIFYGYTAVEAMRSGIVSPLRGDTSVLHRRDDPVSSYSRLLFARWLATGGLIAVGAVMQFFGPRFDKLNAKP